MRKLVLSMTALAAILAAGLVTVPRAEALPVAPGVVAPVAGEGLLQDAAYYCRPIWRCGRYGCGWRRVCAWTRPYVHRHYWGPRWRYRHWHRW
jgi:uncharacterized membrane protein